CGLPDGVGCAGEPRGPLAVTEFRGDAGGQLNRGDQDFHVAGVDRVVERRGQHLVGFQWSSSAEADHGKRLLVRDYPERFPLLVVYGERLLQHLGGALQVARLAFGLTEIGQGRAEPDGATDLPGDGGTLLEQGSRGVQVAKVAMGDAEAVE